ncbi:MAG: UDP-3-O-acyl-N-acetylglucosamine deacetylase [Bacteriovoracales bacterium]|nr:UDP-3-O-acyl-N-acetylglucosamine deacetylase [Bacteriovoracales bacterium]
MIYQRTIAKKVSTLGVGIHSGQQIRLTLKPAPADFGIQFRRIDLPGAPLVAADARNVGVTENNTTLGEGSNIIGTVEHLLSTFYGLGINNVLCELDGPEVPIMDGSCASFVFLLKETGIADLNKSKKFLVVLRPVKVELDDKWAVIEPNEKLIIDSTIIFPHPKIKTQRKVFEFSCESFIKEISRARTFGLLKDVDALKRKGLIKGGGFDNAVVLDDFNVLNAGGLRFKDEFVRHKILDTIGDIALLGHEIAGKITTYKSGHKLHNLLCRKLLETKSAYEIVNISSLQEKTLKAFELPRAITVSF